MLPSVEDGDVPTTSPRLLTLVAMLDPLGIPRLPRSDGEPCLSQSTACCPTGFTGGREMFEHEPDEPTTWPLSLIPQANPTVSPLSRGSSWISPSRPHIRGSKRSF